MHGAAPTGAAEAFWDRVLELADELSRHSPAGDAVWGFAAGVYPTDQPTLPDQEEIRDV